MKTRMIAGRICASLGTRCGLVAALGCIAIVLCGVQSPVAQGQSYTVLGSFNGTDGEYPYYGSLTLIGTTLYGMTMNGGSAGQGNIFSINIDGSSFNNVYSFSSGAPAGSLTLVGTTLWGMTQYGGSGSGNIFSINTDGSSFNNLYSFNSGDPTGSLTLVGTTLYGMTQFGGNYSGNIFSITTAGSSSFNNLYSFANSECPNGSLTLGGSTLFGMTSGGGTNGQGTIFSITTAGSGFNNLHSFSSGDPNGDLTLSGSTLYGMTFNGGTSNHGSIFSCGTNGSNFTTLFSFNGTGAAYPNGDLTLVGSTLYGMTLFGGAKGIGEIFSINTDGTGFQTLISFSGTTGSTPGQSPFGSLTFSGSTLYGMTQKGGSNGKGVVFALGLNPTLAATANATTSSNTNVSTFSFGPTVTATVAAGAGYAQLASYVNGVTPSGNASLSLDTAATIGGGINSTANSTAVNFAWRTRAPNETSDATATSPPMGYSGGPGGTAHYLASDVLQLTGMSVTGGTTTDAYGLSMTYSASSDGTAAPYLATLVHSGTGAYWENAINGNNGVGSSATPGTPFVESLTAFMGNNNLATLTANLNAYVGDWGYDPATDTAWAIIDFQSNSNGNFAFAVVPEPGTIVLLLAGGLVVLPAVGRRLRRA
jgi:uncharacterized repeat protein (TIGR03803 family)